MKTRRVTAAIPEGLAFSALKLAPDAVAEQLHAEVAAEDTAGDPARVLSHAGRTQ